MADPFDGLLDQQIQDIALSLGDVIGNGRRRSPQKARPAFAAPAALELMAVSNRELARFIDHTQLKPEATASMIEQMCIDAIHYGFAAVCVNPDHVEHCARFLKGRPIGIVAVTGFPLGATTTRLKALEAKEFIKLGATELDMVLNIGRMRDRDYGGARADIEAVVLAAAGALVKVILETGLLSKEEKIAACLLARAAGADFVKTSTGTSSSGATVEDVRLLRRVVGEALGVKAAGGIRGAAAARAMLAAGANRIGSSNSIAIVTEP